MSGTIRDRTGQKQIEGFPPISQNGKNMKIYSCIIVFIMLFISGCMAYDGEYSAYVNDASVSVQIAPSVPALSTFPSRVYRYYYYPAEQVYYYPHSRTYFWFQDNAYWMSGTVLPGRFNLSFDTGWLWVNLNSREPYRYHYQTKRKYPRTYRPSKSHRPSPPKRVQAPSRRPQPPKRIQVPSRLQPPRRVQPPTHRPSLPKRVQTPSRGSLQRDSKRINPHDFALPKHVPSTPVRHVKSRSHHPSQSRDHKLSERGEKQ